MSIGTLACNTTEKWQTQSNDNSHLRSPQYPSVYQTKVANYQDSMKVMFNSGANGILPIEDIAAGKQVSYFPPNEKYKVVARFEAIRGGKVFKMPTSTDRLPEYKPFGKLYFTMDSTEQNLTIYQNIEQPDYLFCPFKDLTNGKETYGAGRYLDFELSDTLNPVVDFNYCYNPYCAYNYKYSCPIPPKENHLKIRVEAGVLNYH